MAGTRNVLDITILYVYDKHTKKKKFKKIKKIMLVEWCLQQEMNMRY